MTAENRITTIFLMRTRGATVYMQANIWLRQKAGNDIDDEQKACWSHHTHTHTRTRWHNRSHPWSPKNQSELTWLGRDGFTLKRGQKKYRKKKNKLILM